MAGERLFLFVELPLEISEYKYQERKKQGRLVC